ncbi:MAG TPA: hypothetical protein VN613_12545 [Gemmatimonadaceae bacterium]|nr:hypothetical protein [Gemmatimonadaceae bacterium]
MSSRGYPITQEMRAERAKAAAIRLTPEYRAMAPEQRDAINGPERSRRAVRKQPGFGGHAR